MSDTPHASDDIIEAVRDLAHEDYDTVGALPQPTQHLVDLINQIDGVEPITNPYG